jgi:hypothetical protein
VLQFDSGRSFVQAIQNSAGEAYVQPLLGGKSQLALISTSDTTSVFAAPTVPTARTFTPASMAGIVVGSSLILDQNLSTRETVLVIAVTGTTFTAVCANAHSSAAAAITINGIVMPSAPTGSPAPSSGQPALGWWHMNVLGSKRSAGIEPGPVAGSPVVAAASYDQCYGLLIWCISSVELEINAH